MLLLVITIIQCGTDDCPREFEIPASISPLQSIYKIGDTIALYANFHNAIRETTLNEHFTFNYIKVSCRVYKIDKLQASYRSIFGDTILFITDTSFKVSLKPSSDGGKYLFGELKLNNDTFSIKISFVPNYQGLYGLDYNSSNLDEKYVGQCWRVPVYNIYTKMNNGFHNNIELLKEAPDPYFNTEILKDSVKRRNFYRSGSYVFKVVP